jgi:hypothetical protein
MEIKNKDISHDSRRNKEYERVIYVCPKDDIWVTVETPKTALA